jgi:carboxyvinyl-carboxyphosphonate phosphorylmutase
VLEGSICVHPATVSDPLSAIIAEDLGFETGILAGSIASLAVLASPDRILLTLSELAGLARRITRASGLPILVDGDHGYGNALNVMRTVEELEAAGIAAVSIEDTVLPQPFAGPGHQTFIPIEEGVAKMRAALAARTVPAFVVVGRTTATGQLGLDEAIARGRAYADAGVDALFFPGLKSTGEVEALGAAFDLPLIIGGLKPDAVPREWLAERGVRLSLPGHLTYFAGLRGVHEALKALRETGSYDGVAAVSGKEAARWSGDDIWDARARDYLGNGED